MTANLPQNTADSPQLAAIATAKPRNWFNSESAKHLQIKSVTARLNNKIAFQSALQSALSLPLAFSVNSPQVARVEAQMKLISRRIEDEGAEMKPKELADLSSAFTRLFGVWQVLTGTPNPGSRKSSSGRTKPAQSFDPTPAAPQQVVSSGVNQPSVDPQSIPPVQT